jgi:hypothetical protein
VTSNVDEADQMAAEVVLIVDHFRGKKSKAHKALRFLEYLVQRKVAGEFAAGNKPRRDTQIALQFYNHWEREKGAEKAIASYPEIEDAANKLRHQVRELLKDYYSQRSDIDRWVDIVDEKNRFEPVFRALDPTRAERTAIRREEGITISSTWKNDRLHDLLRTASQGADIRFHITGFVDFRVMRATLLIALNHGARIRILQLDPDCAVSRARFRLRPEMTPADFQREMRLQYRVLKALADQTSAGSLEIRLCDLMPFGFFVQGESSLYGPWMFIGLLPATASYGEGPMIEVRPAEIQLWGLLEGAWVKCWNEPTAAESTEGA